MNMQRRVILITGASRGIGRATARLLGQQGAAVGINYVRDLSAAEQAADEVESAGGRVNGLRLFDLR